ncbi:protein STPG3 isoform X2 [Ornithorhynchus anatinus]|uniref:protein STPG3 isoform X2 n=1 Tax=Ornithorhynchus anatinus TaxID=9258 RepID=UPI0010A8A161|nr:protein STPG3 isoform X2 [Ornithorhynchus anatinus]
MNFDQKVVKFLANYYINGGQHWKYGREPHFRPCRPRLGAADSPLALPAPSLSVGSKCPVLDYCQKWNSLRAQPRPQLTFREALECRPPLLTDLEAPGPAHYPSLGGNRGAAAGPQKPRASRPRKLPRDGGGHRARHSFWCQNKSPFTHKVNFDAENRRPPPVRYTHLSGLDSQRPNQAQPLGFSFGQRLPPLPPESVPGPNVYNVDPGFRYLQTRPPTFSMNLCSRGGLAWAGSGSTPGPGAYTVRETRRSSRFAWAPGILIQGVRRHKRHDTGPFCTL